MTCLHCDKRTYFTRRDARAARTHHEKRRGLSIYPCPHHKQDGDGFHLGLRPEGLGRGDIDRDTLGENQRETLAEGRLAGEAP
ncbi:MULTISPECIES: hypothetical protein [unclassified Rhodococcus (in: high G+C Gram-positive bacteria)]|uniref:hypothetical protein n=1 Tax=unclassified Rhodococcus (in: high G+C Gram-positive bacteria) TaxID=192944 RepID=UPI00163AA055|nr:MULTISPECIES: hypothetical protein [unclassified Rhodococcus (in: high G+C Gram-positive bacteria)]MBC2637848.1 hypothetical protein [Rhodococcus sp. 3A]MBC2897404.1 hypothetical protein [Rhodococcus sp. 4CII]